MTRLMATRIFMLPARHAPGCAAAARPRLCCWLGYALHPARIWLYWVGYVVGYAVVVVG